MRTNLFSSLMLPALAVGLDHSGPGCATDCTTKLMDQHKVDDVKVLCNDTIKQRTLFSCLANLCKPDVYGSALITTITTCSGLGADINTLHPVVLDGVDMAQRNTALELPGIVMAETDCDDIDVLTFDQVFSIAVDCRAGADGVLTLSPPGATPGPEADPDKGDSDDGPGSHCDEASSEAPCPGTLGPADPDNGTGQDTPGLGDNSDPSDGRGGSPDADGNIDPTNCSPQDPNCNGDGTNAAGDPVATLRIPIPTWPASPAGGDASGSSAPGTGPDGSLSTGPDALPENPAGGPGSDGPLCRPADPEGVSPEDALVCIGSDDATPPSSNQGDATDETPSVDTEVSLPAVPSIVAPQPSASPAAPQPSHPPKADGVPISPQGASGDQPATPIEPAGNGSPGPDGDCDEITSGSDGNGSGGNPNTAPVDPSDGNYSGRIPGTEDATSDGSPVTPAGSGGPGGDSEAAGPEPDCTDGNSSDGSGANDPASSADNSSGGDNSNNEDDGLDDEKPNPNSPITDDSANNGSDNNQNPGSAGNDDSPCDNDTDGDPRLDNEDQNGEPTETTLWPHATQGPSDGGAGRSSTTFVRAHSPLSAVPEPSQGAGYPDDASGNGQLGSGADENRDGSPDPIIITVIAPAGQGGAETTVVTIWPLPTAGPTGQGGLKSYGDPRARDMDFRGVQEEAFVDLRTEEQPSILDARGLRIRGALETTTSYIKAQPTVKPETQGNASGAPAVTKPCGTLLFAWCLLFMARAVVALTE
ncbi:hypothetical protein S40288_05965 [Stachybotrys chartarum IBT 40288]|nr:hypothetical protein S40288_05965 [Stachybotrys chartarum IBT 40288]